MIYTKDVDYGGCIVKASFPLPFSDLSAVDPQEKMCRAESLENNSAAFSSSCSSSLAEDQRDFLQQVLNPTCLHR